MNIKLCQGEDVVQGYRDIKNPTDSWVSAGYALFLSLIHIQMCIRDRVYTVEFEADPGYFVGVLYVTTYA